MAKVDLTVNELDYLKRSLASRYLGLKLWLTAPCHDEPDLSLNNALSNEYNLLVDILLKLDDAKCSYVK